MNLFVYGELCRREVLQRELGRVPAAACGILAGYARRRAASGFFVVAPVPGAITPGLVLRDVSREELARLDRFEGVADGHYRRTTVRVRALGGRPEDLDAQAYLGLPEG